MEFPYYVQNTLQGGLPHKFLVIVISVTVSKL